MNKLTVSGKVIRSNDREIVLEEGNAVATYSTKFYRFPIENDRTGEPIAIELTKPLPVTLEVGLHGILVPMQ